MRNLLNFRRIWIKTNFNLKFDNFDCSLDTDAHVLIYFTAGLINRMHRIYNAAWCTSVNVDLIDDCLIKKSKSSKILDMGLLCIFSRVN